MRNMFLAATIVTVCAGAAHADLNSDLEAFDTFHNTNRMQMQLDRVEEQLRQQRDNAYRQCLARAMRTGEVCFY